MAITQDLLDAQVLLYGSRLMENKGKNIVNLFMFKKVKDIGYYRTRDQILSTRVVYFKVPVNEFNTIYNGKVSILDADKNIVAAVCCLENKKVVINSYTTDDVIALSGLAGNKNVQIMTSKFGCSNCGKMNAKLNSCSACCIVKYCSKECQKEHWKKVHKEQCTKLHK